MASASPQDPLIDRLQSGTASSPELEQLLGQSQSTVSRRLRELISQRRIIRIGSRRGARYGLLRPVEGIGAQWPLRRVGRDGAIASLGVLHALAANQYHFEALADANSFAWAGVSTGIPYFLQDQRPGGFLGRAVPQRYPELALPQRVTDWSDAHYLRYLTQRGSDTLGDLILGDRAFDDYLQSQRRRVQISADERESAYPRLAHEVMEGGLPGSSAHGEHPKFAALIAAPSAPRQVLVKFSPTLSTAVGQRWSDLLVAEHLAHAVLAEAGVPSSHSRINRFAGRTFLEVTRFDRVGAAGRIGVTSLLAIDAHLYGVLDNWIAAASRLQQDRRIDAATLETIRLTATFGALIANTDRHFGNLAFYDNYSGAFTLAPVYDSLPMLFAPEHGQITPRIFTPPEPTADTASAYARARALARTYWQRVAHDERVSAEFRSLCASCGSEVERSSG